ncbi:aminoglycoside phosphotransferase family protein [Allokutzneria albata]|uniref:Streptomycin 6-kinase n=1 Tax=Allokutzneria albata TaxID=211114 RepID=A0A1G9RDG5_ALLAB|nr:aminoglycoside phosphotransferase family protein [Allokutzneria albata]SDM21359.1 streptomycin 6-kinase [Allokutzneria albata]
MTVDDSVRRKFAVRFGPSAVAWLDALPALVESLCAQWKLSVERAVAEGGTSRVYRCRREDGSRAFLKLTPDREVAAAELVALRAWRRSPHMVDVLADDLDAGALLLPAIDPGTMVEDEPDLIPFELLRSLREDVDVPATGLAHLSERVRFMAELTTRRAPELESLTGRGIELAYGGTQGLVHGDLHARNVLRGRHGLVAIDPRPTVGDVTFDLVDWALAPAVGSVAELERRISRITAALSDVDGERLLAWCSALAVVIAATLPPGAQRDFLIGLTDR